MEIKTENIINLAVGGAVLFGTVWLISRAWSTGQEKKSSATGLRDSFSLGARVPDAIQTAKPQDLPKDRYECIRTGHVWEGGMVTYTGGNQEAMSYSEFFNLCDKSVKIVGNDNRPIGNVMARTSGRGVSGRR